MAHRSGKSTVILSHLRPRLAFCIFASSLILFCWESWVMGSELQRSKNDSEYELSWNFMTSQRKLKAHYDTETRGFPSMEPISTPAPRTMTRVRSEDGLGKTCCASYGILRETKKTWNLRDSEKECKSEQYWTILHTWISEANWCSKIRWLRSRDRSRIPHLWKALSREVVNWRPRDLDAEIGQSHGRKTDWKEWKRWNLTPNPRIYGGSLCTKVNTSELKVLSRFVQKQCELHSLRSCLTEKQNKDFIYSYTDFKRWWNVIFYC